MLVVVAQYAPLKTQSSTSSSSSSCSTVRDHTLCRRLVCGVLCIVEELLFVRGSGNGLDDGARRTCVFDVWNVEVYYMRRVYVLYYNMNMRLLRCVCALASSIRARTFECFVYVLFTVRRACLSECCCFACAMPMLLCRTAHHRHSHSINVTHDRCELRASAERTDGARVGGSDPRLDAPSEEVRKASEVNSRSQKYSRACDCAVCRAF